jgi:hypothetical protein
VLWTPFDFAGIRKGLDVEVLVASQFWDQDVSEEAAPPVVEWLQQNITEANLML